MSGQLSPNGATIGGEREDGAAFDHSGSEDPGGEEGKLAGKFDSPEDLEKAYMELQSKFTKSRQDEGEPTGEADPPSDEEEVAETDDSGAGDGTIESARKAAEEAREAGIDLKAIGDEFVKDGELSDETYAELEGKGFDKDTVDIIIDGLSARAESTVQTLADVAGGQDNLNAVLKYAAENLSESEAKAYDNAVRTGDMGTAKTMLRGIMAQRADELGSLPDRDVDGKRAAGAGVKPFPNSEAMVEAMQDPRYSESTEYREEVLARVEAMG